ncbi:hypothetical protein [Pacificibacter sp. AS14]|uniref:hypothetical protein n=1 Tax=Pacificibacter sp. AS14 TaxID=3135785 RepID=UPI00317C9F67
MSNKTDAKIDQIIDELVVNDVVAEKLKSKLHEQNGHLSGGFSQTQNSDGGDSEEDLWDNIPV